MMTFEQVYDAYKGYKEEINLGESREDRNAFGRGAFMVAAREHLTLKQVGKIVGKHHSTVIHFEKGHQDNLKFAPYYREFFNIATRYIDWSRPRMEDDYVKLMVENTTLKNQVKRLQEQMKILGL